MGNDKRTGAVRKSTRAKSVAYETRRRREEALLLAEQNPREGGAVSLLPSVRREGRHLLFWSEREVARKSRGQGGLERRGASSSVCSGTRGGRLAPLLSLLSRAVPVFGDERGGFRRRCPCARGKATGPAFGTAGS